MESTYKVHYFNGNGRAANIRAILTVAKANWEDNRVKHEDWPALKASGKLEYGQMPGVEIDGKMRVQTLAVEHLLAKRFNLLGNTEEHEYEVLNVLCSREDLTSKMRAIIYPRSDDGRNAKEELLKNLIQNELPRLLAIFENKFVTLGGKYFLGDVLTLADIYFVNVFLSAFRFGALKDILGHLPAQFSPTLNALVDRLLENELSDYFNNVFIKDSMF